MKIVAAIMFAAMVLPGGGCGSVDLTAYPNAVLAATGRPLLLVDIELIVDDATLSDDEKRAMLRDLGLEDEKLIKALLAL